MMRSEKQWGVQISKKSGPSKVLGRDVARLRPLKENRLLRGSTGTGKGGQWGDSVLIQVNSDGGPDQGGSSGGGELGEGWILNVF